MVEFTELGAAAFIRSRGHLYTARSDGERVFFRFDLTAEEAQGLLALPERRICADYHRAVRLLRRSIDSLRWAGGQDGPR